MLSNTPRPMGGQPEVLHMAMACSEYVSHVTYLQNFISINVTKCMLLGQDCMAPVIRHESELLSG